MKMSGQDEEIKMKRENVVSKDPNISSCLEKCWVSMLTDDPRSIIILNIQTPSLVDERFLSENQFYSRKITCGSRLMNLVEDKEERRRYSAISRKEALKLYRSQLEMRNVDGSDLSRCKKELRDERRISSIRTRFIWSDEHHFAQRVQTNFL